MNVLFLCTANIQRSKTAEDLFSARYTDHNFKSAGLSKKECSRNGSTLCTEELLQWADRIYVFEQMHIERIKQHTADEYIDKIECLNIEDIYKYMQAELIQVLKQRTWGFETLE